MSRVIISFGTLVGLVLLAMLASLTLLPAREDHIGKHLEAPVIRQRYNDGLCDATKVYYASSSGRLMILCQMSNAETTDLWGGIIYKITEIYGGKTIPVEGGAREWSVFAANWHYWEGKIAEGRYRLIADFPTIQRYAKMKGWIR